MNNINSITNPTARASNSPSIPPNAQNAFYNQQMLLQQQYMQLPSIYGSQQAGGIMLQQHPMDIQALQQQHLLQVMQQQQHQQQHQQQQVLQSHPRSLSLNDSQAIAQHQVVLQQQQQYQRALQQAAQQQAQHHQQRQLEQQRLMEQQQRQLDRMHQEREAALMKQQQDEILRQKANAIARQQEETARLQHEELQRQLAAQEQQILQQREAQQRIFMEQRLREEQKMQEEAQKLEEERREMEKVKAVREEQNRRQQEAREALSAMREKAESFQIPIHLAGCHSLTKLVNHLPFPSQHLSGTTYIQVETVGQLGQSIPEHVSDEMLKALLQVDVMDVSLKHEEEEKNDFDPSLAPVIVKTIHEKNSHAFAIEPLKEEIEDVVAPEKEKPVEIEIVSGENKADDVDSKADDQEKIEVVRNDCIVQPESVEKSESVVSTTETVHSSDVASSTSRIKTSAMEEEEHSQLRRQIVSLGKQPKAHQARKKKDMVESLYDSLTGYFDPSEGRRRRQRTKTFEEEQNEKADIMIVHYSSLILLTAAETEHRPDHVGTSSESVKEEDHVSSSKQKTNRKRKHDKSPENRSPTPTEVIQQRELEWRERQRKRHEMQKRRQNDSESDCWNNEVMAEKESYTKFSNLIDLIFENVEDLDVVSSAEDEDGRISQDILIDKEQLEELRQESQKLKSWRKINKVNCDKLVKLLTILERNIRDVVGADGSQSFAPFFDEDEDDESGEAYCELVGDKLLRAADASCTAMTVMTSAKMPKQIFIEDTIDRSIQLCKQFLSNIIFPVSDGLCRISNRSKKNAIPDDRKKRKLLSHSKVRIAKRLYTRVTELVACFSELVRAQSMTDTAVLQLCTLATGPFFVDNIGELQIQCIKLLSAIFSRYDRFRRCIIQDLLNSIHRLPPVKTTKNSYRMTADDWVSNITVLIMQLVQSVVKIPRRRRGEDGSQSVDSTDEVVVCDTIVKDSLIESQKMAKLFLSGFLTKCTSKSEEDYRRLFDQFLHDLLAALYKPEWPAAELLLTLLGNILVTYYRSKNMDMSLRVASLDYLGTIAASLRRDVHQATSDEVRLDIVVKTLVYDELDEADQNGDINIVDISNLNGTDKMKKVQRALVDYLIERKGDADVSIEYAIMFYVGEWYKEVCEEGESAKQKLKQLMHNSDLTDKDKRKFERKTEKVLERCHSMKEFFMKIADKKYIRKRSELIARTGNILIDYDAAWLVKFLASNHEFSQSFNFYLRQILFGIHVEQAVGLRTKAMRCLTSIIEADDTVLNFPEVRHAVEARMTDPNAAVREATIDLIGKYVVANPDFVLQYYPMLISRIKDSGVAVRKRVIRIMREICEKQPNFPKVPEMLTRIVRRITDEEGIKKLTVETIQSLLFQPIHDRNSAALANKVIVLTDMVHICTKEMTLDFLEQLLNFLLKTNERSLLLATQQIVDTLVDNVLTLDSKIASGGSVAAESAEGAATHKEHQERLLACLSTLSLLSKARPELLIKHAETLQPYLAMDIKGLAEQQVMNQVVNMLERVMPLLEHPCESLLRTLDDSLARLVADGGMRIIASAMACASAVHERWPRRRPGVLQKFIPYLVFLNNFRVGFENDSSFCIPTDRKPCTQRALYSVGLMSRHFDLDKIFEGDEEAQHFINVTAQKLLNDNKMADDMQAKNVDLHFSYVIFRVLTSFCRYRDGAIRLKALNAIGNFTARNSEYLTRMELRNMYMTLLGSDDKEYLLLKVQTLANLEFFLSAEESKLVKNNSEWNKLKVEQDLKEMELANSGLASTIIQLYWNAILNCYYNPVDTVRSAAAQVAVLTLSQGLVTPGSSIPTLIAMSTDPLPKIRNKVENMLRNIDSKYAGMVPSKAISGIRCSFRLHRLLKKDPNLVLRGIRSCEASNVAGSTNKIKSVGGLPKFTNDGQAILSGLYQGIRVNRQQRRSFLSSVLRLFSEDSREKLSLEEWVFVADNLAMFPYQVMDEPLYVIRQIESIVSISGQNIINSFMGQLLPHSVNAENDDDLEYNAELIYRRLPEDKTLLQDCMKNSQACFLLLFLKSFLIKLYAFSDAKIQEYSPSEAAKVYEKALSNRKNIMMFKPESALHHLRPEAAQERDTVGGHIEMANRIVAFRNMLLSLDRTNEDDEDSAHNNTNDLSTTAKNNESDDLDKIDECDNNSAATHA